jgi:hypothetical protein
MANICTTQAEFYAPKKAIDWLNEQIEVIRKSENNSQAFCDVFKLNDEEHFIDTLGAKWVNVGGDWGIVDDTRYDVSLESAWHFPQDLIERIMKKLLEVSGDEPFVNPYDGETPMAMGRYWSENFDPIGKFESYDIDNTDTIESSIEEDQEEWEEENPDGYFWDDVVDPAFDNLEI